LVVNKLIVSCAIKYSTGSLAMRWLRFFPLPRRIGFGSMTSYSKMDVRTALIKPFFAVTLLIGFTGQSEVATPLPPLHTPGTLANPGFEGQRMKSVYFFAGQWRLPGPAFYG
jgi:hypothetical protein